MTINKLLKVANIISKKAVNLRPEDNIGIKDIIIELLINYQDAYHHYKYYDDTNPDNVFIPRLTEFINNLSEDIEKLLDNLPPIEIGIDKIESDITIICNDNTKEILSSKFFDRSGYLWQHAKETLIDEVLKVAKVEDIISKLVDNNISEITNKEALAFLVPYKKYISIEITDKLSSNSISSDKKGLIPAQWVIAIDNTMSILEEESEEYVNRPYSPIKPEPVKTEQEKAKEEFEKKLNYDSSKTHREFPEDTDMITVPSELKKDSLYNIRNLIKVANKLSK